jgi:hypothetical protein
LGTRKLLLAGSKAFSGRMVDNLEVGAIRSQFMLTTGL